MCMKYLNFNSKKSLNQEKLIFEEPFIIKVIDYISNFGIMISSLIFGIAFFYVQLNYQNLLLFPLSIITLLLSTLFTVFIFLQIKKSRSFRKIKSNQNQTENINLIKAICNSNNWKIVRRDNQSLVIIIENPVIAYHSGRELYILYFNNIIYLRCLTYTTYDRINPFHWNSQRKIENMIINKINTKHNNT
jgi:hypothetical protein